MSKIHNLTLSRRQLNHKLAAGVLGFGLTHFGLLRNASAALDTMKPLDRASPDTPLLDQIGDMSPLALRVDRPMLVNFWASWCPPCVHELPQLQRLDDALASHNMAVMLIGLDRKGIDFGAPFLADKGITIARSVFDKSGDLPRALKIRVMPSSYFIRPGGQIIGMVEGPLEWDQPDVIDAVIKTLKQ